MGECAAEQGQRSKGAGKKNVTAAAFIALVVYFSTFVSRSLSDCQSASLPLSLPASPIPCSSSAPSQLPLPLSALALKALHRKWLPTGPTRVPGGSLPPLLLQRSFTPPCWAAATPACSRRSVWPRFHLAFYGFVAVN